MLVVVEVGSDVASKRFVHLANGCIARSIAAKTPSAPASGANGVVCVAKGGADRAPCAALRGREA